LKDKIEEITQVYNAPELFPDGFNDWQERLLQRFLLWRKVDEGMKSNLSLVADIEFHTGESLSDETVRRFLSRFLKGRKEYEQKSTDIESLWNIASYLMHPDVEALSFNKIEKAQHKAANHFLLSMLHNADRTPLELHPSYNGKYGYDNCELDLITFNESEFIDIGYKEIKKKEHSGIYARTPSKKFDGYALLTPENNLLFFLKESSFGTNVQMTTLSAPFDFCNKRESDYLVLFYHDEPFEYEDLLAELSEKQVDASSLASLTANKIQEKIKVFEWVKR
jgi:hypothetical protein